MIQVQHLTLSYGTHVLSRDISFQVAPGECILLAGPNGSGKSTLLRHLAAEVGAPIPSAAKCILIPTGIPKVKGFTVETFVRTGCFRESDWAGRLRPETEQRLDSALELLELSGLRNQDLSTLSDGEFQKACIAIGLTRHCETLLLDEPTAYLDVENRLMVLRTLRDITRQRGIAVIFSSHDLHDALYAADRVLAFTPDGRFLESAPDSREEVLRAAFPHWKA